MSSIKGAAGLAGIIQPEPPKKPIEIRVAAHLRADVSLNKDGIDNSSTLFAARAGIDLASFLKARLDSIVDQSQNNEIEPGADNNGIARRIAEEVAALKPSDITGPVILNQPEISESVSEFGRKFVESALEFNEASKEYAQRILEPFTLDLKPYSTTNKAAEMGEGDSFKVGYKMGAAVTFGAGNEVAMEVKCVKTSPPEYTVSVEGSPELTGSFGGFGGSTALGGKVEYKFNNPEDVKRFLEMPPPPQAAYLGDGRTRTAADEAWMQQHIASVEIKSTVGGQYDAKFGIDNTSLEIGTQAGAKLHQGLKVEFENGKPVAIVRTTEFSGTEAGKLGLNLAKSGGAQPNGLSEAFLKGGELKGTVTVETRIPLDKTKIGDVPAILADPFGAAQIDRAENTIKVAIEADGGKNGKRFEAEITQISAAETKQIVDNTLSGKPVEALRGVQVDYKAKLSDFTDSGINVGVDFKFRGVGIELAAIAEDRDASTVWETEQKDFTLVGNQ